MIQKLKLINFRNFSDNSFSFSPETTVIVGPNACGKTNILEAIYLLATGKGFHARLEEEMISHGVEIGRISGVAAEKLEIVLTRGEINMGTKKAQRVARKKLLVNGVSKRLLDFVGNFRATLFGPWDLDLVTESPSIRRVFLDGVLSQVDYEYRRCLLSYEKGLRQRNKLLLQIREGLSASGGKVSRSHLLFWDQLLIKNGDYLTLKREEFIDFTNSTSLLNEQNFSLEYDKSIISEGRLREYAEEEVAAATTLVGPHRDDMKFKILNFKFKIKRDLDKYGSRGEQRMGVLWLKLAELSFIKEKTGEKPTLLLDDIFSELDHQHREIVMEVTGNQQTLITTADPHFIKKTKIEKIIEL